MKDEVEFRRRNIVEGLVDGFQSRIPYEVLDDYLCVEWRSESLDNC